MEEKFLQKLLLPIARQKKRAKKFYKKFMNRTQTVKIFDDKFSLQKTFDILNYIGGIYGFDVLDGSKNFLFHFDGESENLVISEIKWRVYRRLL